MKHILPGFVVLALAVAGGTESVAVCGAADIPSAGRQREFRVIVVDLAEFNRRIADAEANVAERKERLAWAERMTRKGFMSATQLAADRARLENAELALQKLRQSLKTYPGYPRGK
jgi:hypothetical protein